MPGLKRLLKKGASYTNYKGLANRGSRLADAPLSGGAVAAGGAALAGYYAAGSMGESVNSVGTPAPSSASPINLASNFVDNTVSDLALGAAGLSVSNSVTDGFGQVGVGPASVSTMTAIGAAGAGAATYMGRGAHRAIAQETKGKNAFRAPNATKRRSMNYAKRQGARLGNAAYRSMGKVATGATAIAGAAAAVDVVDQTVTRLAKKVMKTGTPGTNLSSNNVLDSQKRMKQTGATTGVSTYAGKGPGVMDGSTVLALHKTGGSGGVLR